jgi:hypothetical protein
MFAAGLFICAVLPFPCNGEDQVRAPGRTPQEGIVAEVPLVPESSLALVAGRCFDEQRLFIFDTGASITMLDESLRPRVGDMLGTMRIQGPFGQKTVPLFRVPPINLGTARVGGTRVTCGSMQSFQEAAGHPLLGILGIDAVERYVVEVDLVGQHLRLLSSIPAEVVHQSEAFEMRRDQMGCYLHAEFAKGESAELLLDTGLNSGISLEGPIFDRLRSEGVLQKCRELRLRTVSGDQTTYEAEMQRFKVGRFEHRGLQVMRTDKLSLAGCEYLRRYIVVFDFPDKRLYLRPSPEFDAPPAPRDKSGLRIIRRGKETVVHECLPDSPASEAGFEKFDRLLQLDGESVETLALDTLRDRLKRNGKTVQIGGTRFDGQFTRKITLREYRKLLPSASE